MCINRKIQREGQRANIPDRETRKIILEDTIERMGIEKNESVMAVVDYIANKNLTPRDVKASMKKVVAASELMETDINVENAKKILRERCVED